MAGPTRITGRIEFSGKFFAARNPGQTIRGNIRDMLADMMRDAESDVRTAIRAGESGRRPVHVIGPDARVSHYIRGRVEALDGKPWTLHGVVSPDSSGLGAREATALLAAASEIERRTHAFRNATRAVKASTRDLAKGLE